MALRRGDWETGDVICHECHLTAPPHPPPPPPTPICLLIHVSAFLARVAPQLPLSFFFFFSLSLLPPTSDVTPPPLCVYFPRHFAVMIYLNTPPGHLSSSSRALSLSVDPPPPPPPSSPPLDITSISPRPVFRSAAAAAALFPT